MIKIFDNHIRFDNPGSLMGGLQVEDLLKGDYAAMHRNKLLAESFYLHGDIEKFGTGFFRIQTELKDYPELKFTFAALNGVIRSELEVTVQDTVQDTVQVKSLIIILDGAMTRGEMQEKLKLKQKLTNLENDSPRTAESPS